MKEEGFLFYLTHDNLFIRIKLLYLILFMPYNKSKERGISMKKSNFLVLSMSTLLALCACGGKPHNDGEVVEKPNMTVNFSEITTTCMVNNEAKAYIDAMKEQEKTLDRPYHFSSLYGPDDYAVIAAASDSGNGANIPAANKGGVDVCDYLDRSDYNYDCKNYPIKIDWSEDPVDFEKAEFKYWPEGNVDDVRSVELAENATSAELPNLYRATKYRAQLITEDGLVSQGIEFTTGDYPRTITLGGVHNVRDIGGFMTSYGVRTNQGLMYRGYYIDDKSGGHGVNWSDAAELVQKRDLQIGYELDLQKESETNGRTVSCLNSEETPCDYKCLTLVSYDDFLKQSSYQNLPEVMSILANSDQKHTYFHCYGGADRTGMLDFFVSAILGVSYTDLIIEFELTTQTNNKRCHMHNDSNAHFPKFLNAFINEWNGYDDSKTVNENCEKWMVDVAGVAKADIEKIRTIMLPGYSSDNKLNDKAEIPTYTASGDWVTDNTAHWKVADEDPNVKVSWGRHKGTTCSVCGHGGSSSGGDQGNQTDLNQPLTRVWTPTSTATNSDGKQYQQLKDNTRNKVGVRILQNAISSTSEATFDSDNKLPSDGKSVTYQITAPKAGKYQMIMNGRVSDDSYNLGSRGIVVKLNGTEVSIDGNNRNGGLSFQGDNDFVMCPTINLTGNEDTITVACRYNRIAFNPSAYLVFAEQ